MARKKAAVTASAAGGGVAEEDDETKEKKFYEGRRLRDFTFEQVRRLIGCLEVLGGLLVIGLWLSVIGYWV